VERGAQIILFCIALILAEGLVELARGAISRSAYDCRRGSFIFA